MEEAPLSKPRNKYILLAVLALAGIVALLLIFLPKRKIIAPTVETKQFDSKANVVKSDVGSSALPIHFPKDIPLEAGAKLLQNYNAQSQDGRFQATRQFESKKSLAENLKIYREFLEKNNWQTNQTIDLPTFKVLVGSKAGEFIQISIQENPDTRAVKVEITDTKTQT